MKGLFKRLTILIIITALALTYLPVTASAAGNEWDGISGFQAGRTLVVTGELRVTQDTVIPEDATLNVREGGHLTLAGGATLTVRGKLAVSVGGTIELRRGTIDVRNPGIFLNYGVMNQYTDTTLNILSSAKLELYPRGSLRTSGTINLYSDAELVNMGTLVILSKGKATVTGHIDNKNTGKLTVQGSLSVTSSGTVNSIGSFMITGRGAVVNSGIISLEYRSNYKNTGSLTNTQRGIFLDKRSPASRDLANVSIFEGEPRTEIRGIDVSFWQGDIDWERVAASSVEFVMIRAGRGATGTQPMAEDTRFKEYIESAQEVGLDVGVYFYSYARTVEQAREEAEFLVEIIRPYKLTYPVAFDIEEDFQKSLSKQRVTDMTAAFLDVLIRNGYFPMIYSYKSFLEEKIDSSVLDTYPVWLAHWYVSSSDYRGEYQIWQTSDKGRISGINGDVDLNISFYNFPEILRKYGFNHLR